MKKPSLKLMQSVAGVLTVFAVVYAIHYLQSKKVQPKDKAMDALVETLIVIGVMTMIPVVTVLPMWIVGRKMK